MNNVEFIMVNGIDGAEREFAIIYKNEDEYLSMPKEEYEAQQELIFNFTSTVEEETI